MRFYTAICEWWTRHPDDDRTTRYQAMKANPDCFAFYRVTGGWLCFYDGQALKLWRNQTTRHNKLGPWGMNKELRFIDKQSHRRLIALH